MGHLDVSSGRAKSSAIWSKGAESISAWSITVVHDAVEAQTLLDCAQVRGKLFAAPLRRRTGSPLTSMTGMRSVDEAFRDVARHLLRPESAATDMAVSPSFFERPGHNMCA